MGPFWWTVIMLAWRPFCSFFVVVFWLLLGLLFFCLFCYSGSETCHHIFVFFCPFVLIMFSLWWKKHLCSFLWSFERKQKCHMCIFRFLAESFLFFYIRQTTELSQLHAAAMTGNDCDDQAEQGQLPAVTATLAPTVLCFWFCLPVVFLSPCNFTREWHSCSKALLSKRLGGWWWGLVLWIDRGSIVSLSQNRLLPFVEVEGTTSDRRNLQAELCGRACPLCPSWPLFFPPIIPRLSPFVCHMFCTLCTYLYRCKAYFLYTCTTDGISIL